MKKTAEPTIREVITPMYFRYHRFAHAADSVDAEIRSIMAGEETNPMHLRRYIRAREDAYAQLERYLTQVVAEMRKGNPELKARLQDKAGRIRAAGAKPIKD